MEAVQQPIQEIKDITERLHHLDTMISYFGAHEKTLSVASLQQYRLEYEERLYDLLNIDPYENFDKKTYDALLEKPPTLFASPFGTFCLRKELVRNLIISCKHLTQKLDLFMLFVGREGAGKSLFARQVNYALWYVMRKLNMIDYDFSLDLVHFGIKELQEDRNAWEFQNKFYRISILDETKDDLGRDKFNTPEAKSFMDYVRRCREERGAISLLLPSIAEILPSLVLSRVTLIFDVDYDLDQESGDIVRGDYKLFTIPRGRTSYSLYHDKFLTRNLIKKTLANQLYNQKMKFEDIPNTIVSFQGSFSNVDVISEKEYLKKKRDKKWERINATGKSEEKSIEDDPYVIKLKQYLNALYSMHKDAGGKDKEIYEYAGINQRTYYRDKKLLNLADS